MDEGVSGLRVSVLRGRRIRPLGPDFDFVEC